jgi:tetratricopeptide (TPR) repeat protein
MSNSTKVLVASASAIAIIIAIVTTHFVRKNISQNDVVDYEQERQNIIDYPDSYGKNPSADKSLLLEAIQYDENNYKAHLLYAEALHNERKYDDALKFYRKAISINPDSTEGYWYRSQCYATLKRYDKAIGDMTKCIQLEPSRYSNYFTRARLYSAINDEVAAIKDCDEIINREDYDNPKYPQFAMVLNNKANSLIRLRKYYEALPLLNKAISLQSNEDTFWGSRGELYYAVGDYSKAFNDFNHAVNILGENNGKSICDDPSSYYYYRGLIHYRLGLSELAMSDLQKAVDMGSVKAAAPLHQIEQRSNRVLIENKAYKY